jgi:heptosyltransferase-2
VPSSAILLVRFGALGDVILATPLVRALRAAHPDAALVFVTRSRYMPVLVHNPHLTEVVTLEAGGSLRRLAARLRGTSWAHRLDLHGSLRSRALRALVGRAWRSCPRQRFRRGLLCRWGIDTFRTPVHAAERYFSAARTLDVVPDGAPAEVFTSAADEARAAALAPHGPYAVLAPGAAHATKRWPGAHWSTLAGRLMTAGLQVVASGTADERALLAAPGVVDAFGLPLGPTAALLRRARVVVANDSGLMHLATAVGAPVVALFGPTARQLGYSPYQARATVLERALRCRPCSPYGGAYCPRGDHRCMIDIVPEQVAAAIATGVP